MARPQGQRLACRPTLPWEPLQNWAGGGRQVRFKKWHSATKVWTETRDGIACLDKPAGAQPVLVASQGTMCRALPRDAEGSHDMVCIRCGIDGYVSVNLHGTPCAHVSCCGVAKCVRVELGMLVCGLANCDCGHAHCLPTHARFVLNVRGILVVIPLTAKTLAHCIMPQAQATILQATQHASHTAPAPSKASTLTAKHKMS
eukprot:352735-Chlamydomonas_euryale.AAC.10